MSGRTDTGTPPGFAEAPAGAFAGGTHDRAATQTPVGTGTWVLNLVTDELVLSPCTRAALGVALDEPFDMADFFATIHPEDLDATSTAFALTTHPRVRAVYDVTYRAIGKSDGVVRWVAARGVALFDDEGFCVRAVGTAAGIHDRHQRIAGAAEDPAGDPGLSAINDCIDQAMTHQDARPDPKRFDHRWFDYVDRRVFPLQRPAYASPRPRATQAGFRAEENGERTWNRLLDLLCTLTPDGAFRSANPAWTALLGWRQEELLDKPYIAFSHPEDRDAMVRGMAEAGAAHRHSLESRVLHKDGSERRIAWSFSKAGTGLFAIGRDITAERQAAEALARKEASLRQELKMVAIGQLAGGIAHDFNNLLQALSGGLDMLERRHVQSDAGRHLIGRANAAIERGSMLTRQLLSFSGRQHLASQIIDVNAMIRASSGSLQRLLEGVGIEWALDTDLWPAVVDPCQLEVALLNLLRNAREAMPAGGAATVTTRNLAAADPRPSDLATGDYVCVSVVDRGLGMNEATLLRAVEPFFTTKGLGGGSGLGLSQAYGFARQSGGTVRLISAPGCGTTVDILLPRAIQSAARPSPAPPAPLLRPKTILVVDDDHDVRELTVAALEECGYTVLQADGGAAGLERLEEAEVDLLLVDFAMPGMTGAELVRLARQRAPAIGVLFMTGYANLEALREYAAPEDILRKPFRLATLTSHVAAVAARQNAGPP